MVEYRNKAYGEGYKLKYSTDLYICVNKEYIMGIHTYAVFFPPKIPMFLYSEVIKSTSQAINIAILYSEQKLLIHLFFFTFFLVCLFGLNGRMNYVVRDSSLSLFLLVMWVKFRLHVQECFWEDHIIKLFYYSSAAHWKLQKSHRKGDVFQTWDASTKLLYLIASNEWVLENSNLVKQYSGTFHKDQEEACSSPGLKLYSLIQSSNVFVAVDLLACYFSVSSFTEVLDIRLYLLRRHISCSVHPTPRSTYS